MTIFVKFAFSEILKILNCILLMIVAQVADDDAGLLDRLPGGRVGGGSGQSARTLQYRHCWHHLQSAHQSGDRSQRQRYGLHSDGRCDHGTFLLF